MTFCFPVYLCRSIRRSSNNGLQLRPQTLQHFPKSAWNNWYHLPEIRLFVHLPGLSLHHVEELGKVNCPISVHVDLEHQVEELVLGGILAHGSHHVQQLLRGNRPAPVLQSTKDYNNKIKQIFVIPSALWFKYVYINEWELGMKMQ